MVTPSSPQNYYVLHKSATRQGATFPIPVESSLVVDIALHELADAAYQYPAVREVWSQVENDDLRVWLLTDIIAREQELFLYEMEDILRENLPDYYPQVFVEHAGLYAATDYVFRPPLGANLIQRSR